jgi:probable F420-dependent oxidoreductase
VRPLLLGVMPSFKQVEPDLLPTLLATVEELGCESVWMPEHVVVPVRYESVYPYNESGRMYMDAADDAPDPLDWLAFAAGCTSTLKLGTAMVLLPEHNPVVLAKRLATIDVLSGGRLFAGIGIGWLREEFDSLGVPYERRGERADEYLSAMHCLWTSGVASFEGAWTSFERVACRPRPTRPDGVPIVIGGGGRPAARRAARYGTGFFPLSRSADDLIEVITMLGEECETRDRDRDEVEVTAFAPESRAELQALAQLNVRRVVLPVPFSDVDTLVKRVEMFRESGAELLEEVHGR